MTRAKAVLIVEDEPDILLMTAELLSDCGFEVATAETADDAVTFLTERAGDVAAVFTDVSMAGSLDGSDLAHVVANTWPSIKILVTSGVAATPNLPDKARFLIKPWLPGDVISFINNAVPAGPGLN